MCEASLARKNAKPLHVLFDRKKLDSPEIGETV